jgi:hypothetical protein
LLTTPAVGRTAPCADPVTSGSSFRIRYAMR